MSRRLRSAIGLDRGGETRNEGEVSSMQTAPSAHSRRPVDMAKGEVKMEQQKLGSAMLDAVDHITGLSADEIDVVADRMMEGARETEDVLRELARRVREHGVFASEKLANFVRAANNCADVARSLQATLANREEPAAAPAPTSAQPAAADQPAAIDRETHVHRAVDLNALGAELKTIAAEDAAPIQADGAPEDAVPHGRSTIDSMFAPNRPGSRRALAPVQTRDAST